MKGFIVPPRVVALVFLAFVFLIPVLASGSSDDEDKYTFCDHYASRGIEQNRLNRDGQCQYTGPAWHSDYDSHYNWCMRSEIPASQSEARFRDGELEKCRVRAEKRPRCEAYAKASCAQCRDNLNRNCGFSGAEWHENFSGHFEWCMTADSSLPDAEILKRQQFLERCR